MSEITLTKKQLKKIKNDMKETEMLTDAEINAIAQKVNKVTNLPFLDEEKEFIVFGKIIKRIDQVLYNLLPNEYYELVKDASDGINKEEATKFEERLTPTLNNLINIPVLTENQEQKLIGFVLSIIINAMVKGLKLEEVKPQ